MERNDQKQTETNRNGYKQKRKITETHIYLAIWVEADRNRKKQRGTDRKRNKQKWAGMDSKMQKRTEMDIYFEA